MSRLRSADSSWYVKDIFNDDGQDGDGHDGDDGDDGHDGDGHGDELRHGS